jgi:hypothetical protein
MIISLDQTVSNLGTERRRMYDIINVLESLQMATKVNIYKNYVELIELWLGKGFEKCLKVVVLKVTVLLCMYLSLNYS